MKEIHKTGRLVWQVVKGYSIKKSLEENTYGTNIFFGQKPKNKSCITKAASNKNLALLTIA